MLPLETPVFHDFVRKYPTNICLRRLEPELPGRLNQQPLGHLLFRATMSKQVTHLQIAEWLKSAAPKAITAVNLEVIVNGAPQIEGSSSDRAFPSGSAFENLSEPAKNEMVRCMRQMKEHATVNPVDEEMDMNQTIEVSPKGNGERISMSTAQTAVQTPTLLNTTVEEHPPQGKTLHVLPITPAAVDTALLLHRARQENDPDDSNSTTSYEFTVSPSLPPGEDYYPLLSTDTFLTMHRKFAMTRTFASLHERVLLNKQDELNGLEERLSQLNRIKSTASPDIPAAGRQADARDAYTLRQKLLREVEWKLKDYSKTHFKITRRTKWLT
jgi:hypothetical protein